MYGGAGGGQDPGEEAFGLAGVSSGEVGERGAAGDDDGGDILLEHEAAGFVGAGLPLGERDGDGFVDAVGEGGDRGWEFGGGLLCVSFRKEGKGGGGGEEGAAGGHGCAVSVTASLLRPTIACGIRATTSWGAPDAWRG